MTVTTDENHIVQSVSLISGLGAIPNGWHLYEYVQASDCPLVGQYYLPVETIVTDGIKL